MTSQSRENEEKLAWFQDVTGVLDSSLSTQILDAHGWDLDAAVNSLVEGVNHASTVVMGSSSGGALGTEEASGSSVWDSTAERINSELPSTRDAELYAGSHGRGHPGGGGYERFPSSPGRDSINYDRFRDYDDSYRNGRIVQQNAQGPGIAWRLVTLPFSMIRGSYNLVYGAVGLGMWVAGGMISYSLGALGLGSGGVGADRRSRSLLPMPPSGASEASLFVRNFEREYGENHPNFQTISFMEAMRRAGQQYKFLFVYLHAPDHANTPSFCENTLCSPAVSEFINENFVAWGGDVRASEGFQMSNSLKASTFPFCAVVTASSNQRIALLQQIEGPRTATELLAILQRVAEEQGAVLVAARVEEEERQLNRRLREEQDAAYQAALQADQERERRRQEEAERAAREAEEAERKEKGEEEAKARAARGEAEREAALERRRQEKANSLGVEPAKAPDVTQVLVRLPNGERKERRFYATDRVHKGGKTDEQNVSQESGLRNRRVEKYELTKYTLDGSGDIKGNPSVRAKTGGWRACPFWVSVEPSSFFELEDPDHICFEFFLASTPGAWLLYSITRKQSPGNEGCERLAFYDISTNLVVYLTDVLHQGTARASTNVTNWSGTCYIIPLVVGFLADTLLGRYWTIAIFSGVYFIGMVFNPCQQQYRR